MKMFLGEYSPNITPGSRIALPKKLRDQITGESVVLSRGFDRCIFVYDANDWGEKAQRQIENSKIDSRGELKTKDLERYLYTSACDASIDDQGRIVIPGNLLSSSGITKRTAIIGVGDHIEVWDFDTWKKYSKEISGQLQ
ncbi:division/cell wall cluster transcriptional repressor MraZ [candidate division WWE3 bacterium]|nr:division/cell wall cluster transcriptional repressor MraZ [candidate division WWE3 bacterium]